MTFDVVAAAYLSWRLGYSRLRAKPDQDSMSAERFGRRIRPYVHAELMAAKTRRRGGDSTASFKRLERAHVLGQVSTRQHALVHWRMLRWAVRQRQVSEIGAQAFRIVGAAVLTGVGLVPEGNTGGGNVSAFRRQPVARDLATIIAAARSG